MSEAGVIPRPEERGPGEALRLPHSEIGRLGPESCPLVVGVDGDRVTIGAPIGGWALGPADREEFMRLWCEAERQAEATMPP